MSQTQITCIQILKRVFFIPSQKKQVFLIHMGVNVLVFFALKTRDNILKFTTMQHDGELISGGRIQMTGMRLQRP